MKIDSKDQLKGKLDFQSLGYNFWFLNQYVFEIFCILVLVDILLILIFLKEFH